MKASYRILWSSGISEIFTVEANDTDLAVRVYAEACSKRNGMGAKVYPATEKPLVEVAAGAGKPCCSGGVCHAPRPVPSTLFSGYPRATSSGTSSPSVPDRDSFATPDSSWLDRVSWEAKNSTVAIHKSNGTYIAYESDFDTFSAYKLWVGMGKSAGSFYNASLKGKRIVRSG